MIFLTVGTQLPFDRMVRAIDTWAGGSNRRDIFGQIGPGKYRPANFQCQDFIDAQQFRQRVQNADIVVAHAGMGSIITALELGKTILVMPRRAALGEHRNDHQVATAERFKAQGRILVAFDESDLLAQLTTLASLSQPTQTTPATPSSGAISKTASPELLQTLQRFVNA